MFVGTNLFIGNTSWWHKAFKELDDGSGFAIGKALTRLQTQRSLSVLSLHLSHIGSGIIDATPPTASDMPSKPMPLLTMLVTGICTLLVGKTKRQLFQIPTPGMQ